MELTKDVSLALAGELDMVNEPQIARQIADLAQPGVHVHLDLTGVTFMDSSALRGLILGQRLCRAQDGDLTITARVGRRPAPHRNRRDERPLRPQRDGIGARSASTPHRTTPDRARSSPRLGCGLRRQTLTRPMFGSSVAVGRTRSAPHMPPTDPPPGVTTVQRPARTYALGSPASAASATAQAALGPHATEPERLKWHTRAPGQLQHCAGRAPTARGPR